MTLTIDGIIFSLQRHGGITVYFQELLKFLESKQAPVQLLLEEPVLQQRNYSGASTTLVKRSARWLERYRPARTPTNTSVFHSSYYRTSISSKIPTVVTVHDFIYERFRTGPGQWAHVAQKHKAIRSAQAIICISKSTRDDLMEWVGTTPEQQVHVIHNGVSATFRPLAATPGEKPFVLYVGERKGYKNFSLAIQALARIPDVELRCVGGGALLPDEMSAISKDVQHRVSHLGYVTDEVLNEHYNLALCLVYPSRYEGFGIPVVEAMRAGCPVVSIRCKAVIEVGGDALMVAEEDPVELSKAILRCAEPAYRRAAIQSGLRMSNAYSWDATHEKTLSIYHSLIKSHPQPV